MHGQRRSSNSTTRHLVTGFGGAAGVQLGDEELPASAVVLAMGPWTGKAAEWLPGVPRIYGQLGHSVVLKAEHPLSSHCFFVGHNDKDGKPAEPMQSVTFPGSSTRQSPGIRPAPCS